MLRRKNHFKIWMLPSR